MNRIDLIRQLNNVYDIKSNEANKFIRRIKKSDVSTFGFIISQIKYIRFSLFLKLFAYAIVLLVLVLGKGNNQHLLFSYAFPINALIFIYIIDSSRNNHMEELEMATRFSLKTVILARILISGLLSFVLICFISIFTSLCNNTSLFETFYAFFLPYWATIFLSLKLLRKYRDKGFKYCLILSLIISLLIEVINLCELNLSLFTNELFMLSTLLLVVILLINELKNYIKNMEELLWSL